MVHEIKGLEFTDIYGRAFGTLNNIGASVDSRNGKTIELLNVVLEQKDPQKRVCHLEGRNYNIAFAVAELLWILSGRGDAEFITHYNKQMAAYFDKKGVPTHGSYGIRLRKWGSQRGIKKPVDQITEVYKKLKANPDDRRAVMMIFDPELDNKNTKDIPCNNRCHLLIRDNKLTWFQDVRSNDLLWGVPYNFFVFTCLQELMASWLGVGLGSYIHRVDSLHIYADREHEISNILRNMMEKHPFSDDHLWLYDIYKSDKIHETFKDTEINVGLLMILEPEFRQIDSVDDAHRCCQNLFTNLRRSDFWLNCGRVLLSYNMFKNAGKDRALEREALRVLSTIDNDFQYPLADFFVRKKPSVMLSLDRLIPEKAFGELDRRYRVIRFNDIEKEVK